MATKAPAPSTRRINRGNGHSYVLDGQPCDGVTTIMKKALPKPALVGWAAREIAQLVCERRDILTQLSDDEVVDLLKGAPFRTRDAAANKGQQVHKLAEQLSRGEEVEVPDHLVGHVDAFLAWDKAFSPVWEFTEAMVINRRYRICGTLDGIAQIRGLGRVLLDIKTNRSGPFGETALQLAGYGNAETIIDSPAVNSAGIELPMPEIDAYYVLWLTGDGFEFIPYDVTDREWRTFLYLQQVAHWVDQREKVVRGYAVNPPAKTDAA